jgi:hypothetical protein
MYGSKSLMIKVINLFEEHPEFRDDRWGTIKNIMDDAIPDKTKVSTDYLIQTAFTIDRFFRYVQQHMAHLRGEEWEKRQKRGGNHIKDDLDAERIVLKYKNQLKLF